MKKPWPTKFTPHDDLAYVTDKAREITDLSAAFGASATAIVKENNSYNQHRAINEKLDWYAVNVLQYTMGSTSYVLTDSYSNLDFSYGSGWNSIGSGALATPSSPFTINPFVNYSIGYMGGASNYISPLVLDLDGDGVAPDLTHAYRDGKVFFDIDGDGYAERVGWVKPDDGLLANVRVSRAKRSFNISQGKPCSYRLF